MDIAYSVNRVPIRLTDERWQHIVDAHDELAGYFDDCLQVVEQPDWVLRGNSGSHIAVRAYGKERYLLVVYREVTRTDGFVITAYFSRKVERRRLVWPRFPRKPR